MKKIFTLIALAVVTVLGAKAQDITDNYNRIHAGFSTFNFERSEKVMKGFNAGYTYGINVTGEDMPMFVEVGAEYNYVTITEDSHESNFHAIQVPVNFTYKFGTEEFNVAPFIGETLRTGLSFKADQIDFYDDPNYDFTYVNFYLNLGVNFNIMQHFTIGYRFMMSNGSMQPKITNHTTGTVTGDNRDYNNLFYVAYCF